MTAHNWILIVQFAPRAPPQSAIRLKVMLTDFSFEKTRFIIESDVNDELEKNILSMLNFDVSLRDTLYIMCDQDVKKYIAHNLKTMCERARDFIDIGTTKILLKQYKLECYRGFLTMLDYVDTNSPPNYGELLF